MKSKAPEQRPPVNRREKRRAARQHRERVRAAEKSASVVPAKLAVDLAVQGTNLKRLLLAAVVSVGGSLRVTRAQIEAIKADSSMRLEVAPADDASGDLIFKIARETPADEAVPVTEASLTAPPAAEERLEVL